MHDVVYVKINNVENAVWLIILLSNLTVIFEVIAIACNCGIMWSQNLNAEAMQTCIIIILWSIQSGSHI